MQQNIEHPENDACYESLAVNKGIEQPDPVNPAIAERLKHLKKKIRNYIIKLDLEHYLYSHSY